MLKQDIDAVKEALRKLDYVVFYNDCKVMGIFMYGDGEVLLIDEGTKLAIIPTSELQSGLFTLHKVLNFSEVVLGIASDDPRGAC